MVRPDNRDGRQGDEFRSDSPRMVGRRGGSPNEALQPQRMPPPPKRTRRKPREGILSIASGVLSFLLVVALAAAIAVSYAFHKLDEAGPLDQDKIVFIARGTGTADAIEKLEAEKVIDGGWLFNLGLKLSNRHIKAGEYRFTAHASARQVMATLTEGKPLQHVITLPEGLTSQQIVQRLKELKDDDGNELLSGDLRVPREGSLMPDTYKFSRGDSRESIIKRMSTAQTSFLEEVWKARDPKLPIRSSYDLVTLASIVEKETGKADERPMVAGVFVNRLNKRMKLQSDPTIIYGLVGGQGSLGRPLKRSEIDKPTPYNTYSIEGLPPGPIANPGRAAMEAVARPAKTKALFFVADGTGGHAFAETNDQHLKNVARWRQIEKAAKDKASPDTDPETARPPPGSRTEAAEPVSRDMMAKVQEKTFQDRSVQNKNIAAQTFQDADDGTAPGFESKAKVQGATAPLNAGVQSEKKSDPRVFQVGSLKVDLGPAIDQRGWSMDGVDIGSESETASASMMGDDPPSNGSSASYPMSPGQLADLRARQKKYASATDLVPDTAAFDAPDTAESFKQAAMTTVAAPQPDCSGPHLPAGKRPEAFDASEGTRLDPMRNKSFDLNSVKIVPEAGVDLIPVFSTAGAAQARLASLVAAGDCTPDTRTADRGGKADRIQVASLANGKGASDARSRLSDGFDASEGTRLDPLRNRRYDITTTVTVPGQSRIFEIPADLLQPLPDPPAVLKANRIAVGAPMASLPGQKPDGAAASRGFDASEGTQFDPLRDKSFDLNSAQTVPAKTISFDAPTLAKPEARKTEAGTGKSEADRPRAHKDNVVKTEHRRPRHQATVPKEEAVGQHEFVLPPQDDGDSKT